MSQVKGAGIASPMESCVANKRTATNESPILGTSGSGPPSVDSACSNKKRLAIRQMVGPEEVQWALDWAVSEGWNPGLRDAECFFAADPDGFFVGHFDGEPIATCFAVVYDDMFAFLGGYFVRPEFRGRGYGRQMIRAAMAYVGYRNLGLDAMPSVEKELGDWTGCQAAHGNTRYEGTASGNQASGVAELRHIPFDELVAYDTVHFGAPRIGFLRRWIDQPDGAALGAVFHGRLAGYGVVRPCHHGFKIGPLFADNSQLADDLFESLCARVTDSTVLLDTPETNPGAAALAERHGMAPAFETVRMYRKGQPEFPAGHVFGVTSLELG